MGEKFLNKGRIIPASPTTNASETAMRTNVAISLLLYHRKTMGVFTPSHRAESLSCSICAFAAQYILLPTTNRNLRRLHHG